MGLLGSSGGKGSGPTGLRGLFAGMGGGQGISDNLAIAQMLLNGDPGGAASIRARQQQLAAQAAHQQQSDQASADSSRMFQEGLGALGYSKPEIQVFAAHPESATGLLQSRLAPYSQSPGETRVTPGVGGAADVRNVAPTADQRTAEQLDRLDPSGGLSGTFWRGHAMSPTTIPPGGGVAGAGPDGQPTWLVPPASVGPASTGPAPNAPRVGGQNNPGGLRVSGSTAFRNFPTLTAGIEAQERLLRERYLNRPTSIRQIVERYAPRRSRGGDNTDEQVDNYIAYVSRQTGIPADQQVGADFTAPIARAMRGFETGQRPPRRVGSRRGGTGGNRALEQARAAIARGADPVQVRARLRQLGVSDAGL